MVIGHQKGRDTKEKILRNFGMPKPEGYRKALRLMKLAEKFELPVFTFVDTPGAYPGIDAEERGQSEAIGRNLYEMASCARRSSPPSSAKAARAARSPSPWATSRSCCSTPPTR
jgi:acetyl-CoA carboxylase alpha subunit